MRKTHTGTRTRHGGVIGNSDAGARCRRRQRKRACDKARRGRAAEAGIDGAHRVVDRRARPESGKIHRGAGNNDPAGVGYGKYGRSGKPETVPAIKPGRTAVRSEDPTSEPK